MKPRRRGAASVNDITRQQHQTGATSDHRHKTAVCGVDNGDMGSGSGENSPIYHELDPVVVASEPPPLSPTAFHAYQSIAELQLELVQLKSSESANSFDSAPTTTTPRTTIPPSFSCGDVTTQTTSGSGCGSKRTFFSRLRLPHRATRGGGDHVTVVSTSGTDSQPPGISASGTLTPAWRGENITTADYSYPSAADVRRHLEDNQQRDVDVRRRGRRRLVSSSPFSSPCCGVRMAEIRAAWRIQSCGPRIMSEIPVPLTCAVPKSSCCHSAAAVVDSPSATTSGLDRQHPGGPWRHSVPSVTSFRPSVQPAAAVIAPSSTQTISLSQPEQRHEQITRQRASRLPGYSVSGGGGSPGSRNGFSPSRTQSADCRPPVAASTTAKSVLRQSVKTPPSTSSERSTSSADTPTETHNSPRRSATRRTSHLRPPKTIVSRQRLEHLPADDVIDTSPRHGISSNTRPQSADSSVELRTSFVRKPGITSSQASQRYRGSSSDSAGQRSSRLVPPRACVQRQQSRD